MNQDQPQSERVCLFEDIEDREESEALVLADDECLEAETYRPEAQNG